MIRQMIARMGQSRHVKLVKTLVRPGFDALHYYPHPWFKPSEVIKGPFSSLAVADTLRRDGVCILNNYLNNRQLTSYQKAMNLLVQNFSNESDTPGGYTRSIDFTACPIFVDLVLDELVLAAVEAYYGKPIYLAASLSRRLYPIEPYEQRSFSWHHDAKGKMVKAMWLLTDVPITGQRMSYVLRSHLVPHKWRTYEDTRLKDNEAKSYGEILECSAPAGSVIVFDTNGIHRGNRNLGPIRDTVFGVYSLGRYRQGCQFDLKALDHLSVTQKRVLERSRKPSKGYG